MFERPRHNAILKALHSLDAALFRSAECFFGGGTAIVLSLGEYRESADIDFLCASQDGYRRMREAVWTRGFDGLLKSGAKVNAIRDMRSDQYGLRTVLEVDKFSIRFEIIREARIALAGEDRIDLGVSALRRDDMFAEKLLANSDRWNDTSVLSRDVIDLSVMVSRWGPIPEAAWVKARAAYGAAVEDDYRRAVLRIRDRAWLSECMSAMGMDLRMADEIDKSHGLHDRG